MKKETPRLLKAKGSKSSLPDVASFIPESDEIPSEIDVCFGFRDTDADHKIVLVEVVGENPCYPDRRELKVWVIQANANQPQLLKIDPEGNAIRAAFELAEETGWPVELHADRFEALGW